MQKAAVTSYIEGSGSNTSAADSYEPSPTKITHATHETFLDTTSLYYAAEKTEKRAKMFVKLIFPTAKV